MDNEHENNKRSRNIGLLASLSFHSAIALILFLWVAWKAPNPPLPEIGLEINLGFTDTGDGEVQPLTEVGDEGQRDESITQPQETQPEVVKDVAQPEDTEPLQEEIVTDDRNPVSVKEEKNKVKEEVKKDPTKEVVKVIPKEEKKVVKEEAVYTPKETTDKTTSQKKGENLSQGNDKNTKGDKGQPDGTRNPDAEYTGVPGGESNDKGSNLQLKGWKWDRLPNPVFPGNERGVIVYTIEVDSEGDIIGLTPDKILSQETDMICRAEIRKLLFSPIGSGSASGSKGKITIVVKAQ